MRLHAQQNPPLAPCDFPAKGGNVLGATPLDSFDYCSHSISEISLGENLRGAQEQSQKRGGHHSGLRKIHSSPPYKTTDGGTFASHVWESDWGKSVIGREENPSTVAHGRRLGSPILKLGSGFTTSSLSGLYLYP